MRRRWTLGTVVVALVASGAPTAGGAWAEATVGGGSGAGPGGGSGDGEAERLRALVELVDDALAGAPAAPVPLVVATTDDDGTVRVRVEPVLGRVGALAAVAAADAGDDAAVVAVEVDRPMRLLAEGTSYGITSVGADDAWAAGVTGDGVTVAVVDTGVQANHPDLGGRVLAGRTFLGGSGTGTAGSTDDHGHGTHVAGIVAAERGNNMGFAGVAPDAAVLPVRVLDADGNGWSSDVAAGIVWATDQGADVINLSLGGPYPSTVIQTAVQYATAAGVVVVASAGNEGTATPNYPAAYTEAIAVAASNSADQRWTGSNSGAFVDLTAPGVSIPSTYPTNLYALLTGTSMAAPHVAGVAALLLQHRPAATAAQVRAAMEGSARDVMPAGRDDLTGFGLVDAPGAMTALAAAVAAPAPTTTAAPTTAAPTTAAPTTAPPAPTTTAPTTTTAPPPATTTTTTPASPTTTAPTTPPTTAPTTTPPPTTNEPARPRAGIVGDAGAYTVRDGRLVELEVPTVGATGAAITASSATATGAGAWAADATGRVYTTGDARFLGDLRNVPLNRPINGMAPTPTGDGYWMVASDGGIFAYGDARFLGSTGSIRLNRPVVGMTPTASGDGYWLVASDGGIFAYGDARFFGSTGSLRLNLPINGMAATPSGNGYWLFARDGGIFAFGDAAFYGSLPGVRGAAGAVAIGMIPTETGRGYWIVTTDGRIFPFGDAT